MHTHIYIKEHICVTFLFAFVTEPAPFVFGLLCNNATFCGSNTDSNKAASHLNSYYTQLIHN